MRMLILLLLMALVNACSTPYGFKSKGYFQEDNPPEDLPLFTTSLPHRTNDLPKLTGGNHNYFVWSTVRYNVIVDEEEHFASFRTLRQDELPHLDPEEKQYLRTQGSLLNNYLFFLDDYRFIYLSEDDHRNEISYGQIPVYFDNDEYTVPRDAGSSFNQLIRGYYSLEGDQLFFDFGSVKHFYIKATVHNQNAISFDSIFIPEKKLLNAAGINNKYVPFQGMLHATAQPRFEVPREDNPIRWPEFSLNTGFLWGNPKEKNRNALHEQLLEKAPDYAATVYEQVTDIQYDFTDKQHPVRRYTIELLDKQMQPRIVKITEDLIQIPTW